MRWEQKNVRNLNAANSDRIAYWRRVHRSVSIAYCRRILTFILLYISFLSISSFPHLSISVSPYLHLPPYLHLISITISLISLLISANENNSKRGNAANNSVNFYYWYRNRCTWRKHKYIETKDDGKIKRQKSAIANTRETRELWPLLTVEI